MHTIPVQSSMPRGEQWRFRRYPPVFCLTGETSCKDEARIGQKNGLVRQWARRGTRPRQPADQRYESAYLFGAICPARGVGAALALPFADTEAMQLHLEEISRHVAEGAHAVLLLDRAGWHTTAKLDMPRNITPIFLPSRAPELNPVENIWQFMRGNWLSNLVFDTYDDIIDAACDAWRKLIAQPDTITSIGMREWAHIGQTRDSWYNKPRQLTHGDSLGGDSLGARFLTLWELEDLRRASSSEIARGLFGRGASGAGPAVQGRQSEPAASVACGGSRRMDRGDCGQKCSFNAAGQDGLFDNGLPVDAAPVAGMRALQPDRIVFHFASELSNSRRETSCPRHERSASPRLERPYSTVTDLARLRG